MQKRMLVCLVAAVLAATIAGISESADDSEYVSLVRVIANPERYDEKVITLHGFLSLDFEGTALYLHSEHYERGMGKEAVWLTLDRQTWKAKQGVHRQYVLITGKFDAQETGHLGLFSGGLRDITRIQPLPVDRRRPSE
jgi:hypothetical protein